MGVTARGLRARRGAFVLDVAALEATHHGTVVLGPNGAGKTTLLLALQGLIAADGVVARPPRAAAVFARPSVLRGSVLWNVATVFAAVAGADEREARVRARDALGDVGLRDVADSDARTLSTGQRQRLALARALVVEPEALFLDEPFANVDADARPALRALVRSYAGRTRCALILATSSFADAAALCRDAVVLRDGRVTHTGPLTALDTANDPYVRALLEEAAALGAVLRH
ncbi:MAG: modC [Candidatus Eremiobacteraeota bacterium]|nr:modC [Candidatus Eremiobacteraeota bacterium]